MPKVPEDPFSASPHNQSVFNTISVKDDFKALGVRGDKKQYFNQPMKGLKLSGSARREMTQRTQPSLLVSPTHNQISNAPTEADDLKQDSILTNAANNQ